MDKGYRLGRFFRSFFEYYYQFVLHPADTISMRLLRAISVKVDLFEHEDIAHCVDIETSGKISGSLEDLSINNIYIKIPEAFDAIKFMKLKDKPECRDSKYLGFVTKLRERIEKIDMFRVMYHEYEGFVEIAAEKYGNYQVEAIGEIFANIIGNPRKYEQLSQQEL